MFCTRIDDNLVLRLAEERDAQPLQNLIEADRARLRVWLGWIDESTVESTREHIRLMRRRFADGGALLLAIVYGGAPVGLLGFNTVEMPPGKAEVGYWLGGAYEGRGIMTRCCRTLIDYGFGEMGLHRIEIRAAEGNVRSLAVAERLGFRQEGVLRGDALVRGEYIDHVV